MPGPRRVYKIRRDRKRILPVSRASSAASSSAVANIEICRTLRRDFGLNSADIANLDIDLAIEAGLLSRPARPKR